MVWNDKRYRGSGKYIDRSYTASECMYVYMQCFTNPCNITGETM